MSPQPGLRFSQSILVEERLTVPAVSPAFTGFSDMPPVFATAFLVGFVESRPSSLTFLRRKKRLGFMST